MQQQTDKQGAGALDERPKADDKLLDLVLAKTESTKKDLEKNWSYQITSVGISLGVVLGLGDPLAEKYFEVPGYVRVLYLALPLVNLYLFMRFGSLASAFSEARFAAERLAKKYFKDNRLDTPELSRRIEPSVIYATNSYFEYFHHSDASLAKFAYSLFLPFLFALSHSVSLYLLLMFFGFNLLAYVLCALVLRSHPGPVFRVLPGQQEQPVPLFEREVEFPAVHQLPCHASGCGIPLLCGSLWEWRYSVQSRSDRSARFHTGAMSRLRRE